MKSVAQPITLALSNCDEAVNNCTGLGSVSSTNNAEQKPSLANGPAISKYRHLQAILLAGLVVCICIYPLIRILSEFIVFLCNTN